MSATVTAAAVQSLEVAAYAVPTADGPESDGTLEWDATTIVVVHVHADGLTGLGYTYSSPTAAAVIEGELREVVVGADALMPERCFAEMQVASRQLGHGGIAPMAISAVDVALWDLKARLLGVCLADALPRYREGVPIYGSGGFTSYDDEQLREQAQGWARAGMRSVKIKVGRDPDADPHRVQVVRDAAGPDVELMVDANGAFSPQRALEQARRFRELGVTWFEEPVSSDDLEGLGWLHARAPAGLEIAAGEYAWNLFDLERTAGVVDVLQGDVTRCGGITNLLRADGLCKARCLPFSAHCAPAISAHACCAMETVRHIEYFHDHVRIEDMLFDGALQPDDGMLVPDRSRPGLGVELDEAAARPYRV